MTRRSIEQWFIPDLANIIEKYYEVKTATYWRKKYIQVIWELRLKLHNVPNDMFDNLSLEEINSGIVKRRVAPGLYIVADIIPQSPPPLQPITTTKTKQRKKRKDQKRLWKWQRRR